MTARGVFVRFGCVLFAAGISVSAQYTADIGAAPIADGTGRPFSAAQREHSLTTGNWIPDRTIPRSTTPANDDIISFKRLAHTVPSTAQKEYDKANSALAKNRIEEAEMHFENAVQIDPDFVEAVNDLGAAYARLGKNGAAIQKFEKAASIDPTYGPAFYNMSLLYLGQERLEDAARAARTSLEIDPAHAPSRLVLGMALVFGDHFTDEAVENLRRCADDYPQARLFLARALAGRGEKAPARSEIERFLASGEKTGRDLAQSWLQALR